MSSNLAELLLKHDYELVKFLDKGTYGSCYTVKSLKYNSYFVCKSSNCDNLSEKYFNSFMGEAEILSKLNHPNIVRIYDYFIEEGHFFIILEYCSKGSLLDILNVQKHIEFNKVIKYASEIIDAIMFMHSKGIAHCDIKLSNILIDQYDRVKICDFGLSHKFNDKVDQNPISRIRGTLNYMAPEIILALDYDPFKADVWAVGITIYAMLTGSFPFGTHDVRSILKDMKAGCVKLADEFGKIGEFVDRCLDIDPDSRPTMAQLKFRMIQSYGDLLGTKIKSTQKIFAAVARQHIIVRPSKVLRSSISAVY